jgi:hypothetical protein
MAGAVGMAMGSLPFPPRDNAAAAVRLHAADFPPAGLMVRFAHPSAGRTAMAKGQQRQTKEKKKQKADSGKTKPVSAYKQAQMGYSSTTMGSIQKKT